MLEELLAKAGEYAREAARNAVFGSDDDLGPPVPVVRDDERVETYGLHQLLPYDQYDPQTGLFFNTDSVGFCLAVAAQTGADDELTKSLHGMFAAVPANHGIQWMLFGDPVIEEKLDDYVNLRRKHVSDGQAPSFYLAQAQRRAEFLRSKLGAPLFAGRNYSITDKKLVFSIVRQGSHTDVKLVDEMHNLQDVISATLRSANLASRIMGPDDLLRYLWPILNPEVMFNGESFAHLEYDDTRAIRDQLTAFGHHSRVKPDHLLVGLPPEDRGAADERIAVRTFGVHQYPKKKELWEMHNIIGSFFNEVHQYPCPFLITGGVYTLDQNAVETKATLKSARAMQNAQSKMAKFQPELSLQHQDWQAVMAQLNEGGALCELYHSLTLFAPRKQINKCEAAARGIWRSERFHLFPMRTQQLTAFVSTLPMMLTGDMREDLKKFRLITTKTTVNATDMAPIIGEWTGTSGSPNLLFFGRRGTPTLIDLYASSTNYNGFVDGTSGAGKSVLLNELISAYRSVGGIIRIVDVGYSYRNQIELAGGTYIDFYPGADIIVNPFTWAGQDSELKAEDEVKFIRPIIGRMAAPTEVLSDFQNSLLDKAVRRVWNDYGPDGDPTKVREALLTLKDQNDQVERVAYELAVRLEPFCTGGIYGRYVNGRANISLDNEVIGLELEHLNSDPNFRTVVLLCLTNRVANEMYRFDRTRKKLFLIDEAWQLLGGDKETATFIEEGYRRARKYEGSFFIATQAITDAQLNAAAQAAFDNSAWKFHLKQSQDTLKKLEASDVMDLPPALKRMLASLQPQAGLYSEFICVAPDGGTHVLRHIPDEYTLAMSSTKGPDFEAIKRMRERGASTEEAIQFLIESRRKK
ncbi:type IV secretion system protein TraC (plasmid) [Burkholderia thailandensis]|nr:type IV secretion system protein TraC [Burkholderia thailandensis]MBS2132341.1 type IV secretion system protein TraC [Burkholderia thailandensis]QRA15404.1 type IV secretion system protein TraC [Burkholderia thailandensis]